MGTSSLTTTFTKILSEPRPKPVEKEKPKKEDKKKDKKDKKDKDKNEDKDKKEENASEDNDDGLNASSPVPEKRTMRRLLLRFLLPLAVIVPVAAIFAGYGEPYGISAPSMPSFSLPFWHSDEGGDDYPVEPSDSAEVEGAGFDEPVVPEPPAEAPE